TSSPTSRPSVSRAAESPGRAIGGQDGRCTRERVDDGPRRNHADRTTGGTGASGCAGTRSCAAPPDIRSARFSGATPHKLSGTLCAYRTTARGGHPACHVVALSRDMDYRRLLGGDAI